MSDIIFNCPHCGQEIEIPERLAASPQSCPTCGQKIASPLAETRFWNFDCPACGQNLEVEAEAAGTEIECPKCVSRLRAPSADHPAEVLARGALAKDKSATARIRISPNAGLPPPRSRILTIKRTDTGRTDPGYPPPPFSRPGFGKDKR